MNIISIRKRFVDTDVVNDVTFHTVKILIRLRWSAKFAQAYLSQDLEFYCMPKKVNF